jgi:uncharacterized repeat protein (TIGR03803 family)
MSLATAVQQRSSIVNDLQRAIRLYAGCLMSKLNISIHVLTTLITKKEMRVISAGLALVVALLAAIFATQPAQAQTFSVLYSFTGGADGGDSTAGLIRDAVGNLYGTTSSCGPYVGCIGSYGTVFKLDTSGNEIVLYSFSGGTDGAYPYAGLVHDRAGNFYGTTKNGGNFTCPDFYGCGTVFKLDRSGNETVLYRFSGTDGEYPVGDLLRDTAGNLYGTTSYGGLYGDVCYPCGTVFKVDTAGKETVLYSFTGNNDGGYPLAGLVRDSAGNLYGTTLTGGSLTCDGLPGGCGTVFKLDTAGKETALYTFTGGTDGAFPYGGLVLDAVGNLYGTTGFGGDLSCQPPNGCGTVFKLTKTGRKKVLYSFTGNGVDGAVPNTTLVRDAAGNLYGTTNAGGIGAGVVFKVDKAGTETVLYSFTNTTDGAYPAGRLLLDAAGNLYGTTPYGGDLSCQPPNGCGTVFKVVP